MGKILNQTPTMGMARKTGVAKDWVRYPQQLMLHRNFCIMGISRRNHQLRRLNQICMPPLHHLQEKTKKNINMSEGEEEAKQELSKKIKKMFKSRV